MLRRSVFLCQAAGKHYQAVVVGGGSAGCVVATQLAAVGMRVALVEAGEDISKKPAWHYELPASQYVHRLLGSGYEATDITTTPQHSFDQSRPDAALPMPYPRVMGGSGVMGGRSWIIGPPSDFEGTPWEPRDLEEVRKRWESSGISSPHRGQHGRLSIGRPISSASMYRPFCEALVAEKVAITAEFNPQGGKMGMCAGRPEVAVDPVEHKSSITLRTELLQAMKLRRNMEVKCQSKAVGFTTASEGSVTGLRVKNTKTGAEEVLETDVAVLTAGPVSNAQIVLGSEPALVTPALEDAVGKNYFDCPRVVLRYKCHLPDTHHVYLSKVTQYLAKHTFYSGEANALCSGYDDMICLWSSEGPSGVPDVRITLQPFAMNNLGQVPQGVPHAIQFIVELLTPESRGEVLLNSVNPGYYTAARDREVMNKAVEFVKKVAQQSAMKNYTNGEPPFSITDEASCRGGGTLTINTAVDPATLAVRGMSNVFCCDCSLLPHPVRGDYGPLSVTMADLFVDIFLDKKGAEQKKKEARGTGFFYTSDGKGGVGEGASNPGGTVDAGAGVKVTYY